MSVFTSLSYGVSSANTVTQTLSIAQQLEAGVRYFDIHPSVVQEVNGPVYGTASFNNNPPFGWQGAFGQPMSEIIDQVNAFTASNAELLIFELSKHALDLTSYEDNYVNPFSQKEWDGLLQLLLTVNHRCTIIPDLTTDVTLKKVGEFLGSGQASVLFVIRDPSVDLSKYAGQGFINGNEFGMSSMPMPSDDDQTVVKMQLDQMKDCRPSADSTMVLLEWFKTLEGYEQSATGNLVQDANSLNKLFFYRSVVPLLEAYLLERGASQCG